MALASNGVSVEISSELIPSGYVKATVTKFTDYEYVRSEIVTVAKSAVENADQTVTFENIVDAIKTALDAIITADYDTAGLTVTTYADFNAITMNYSLSSLFYDDSAQNYLCTCKLYVKTA